MGKIKVSHEVPLQLMKASRAFNDYDYALVHLFDVYPEYLQFFKDSLAQGREVLLDNSIFELKKAFDEFEFANWVEELAPTRYIIPDVLDDYNGTIENIISWKQKFPHLKGNAIGVVQGRNYEELTECYDFIAETCDEIAICFPHSHHQSKGLTKEAFKQRMLNRQELLFRWLENDVIRTEKRHHLLGCLLPQEFRAYKYFDWIYSLDTSNPILHGMYGVLYKDGELDDKISVKMADVMELPINEDMMADIMYNVTSFKQNLL